MTRPQRWMYFLQCIETHCLTRLGTATRSGGFWRDSIETSRGGSPPPTHPWRSGKSVIDVLSWQVFDVYGLFCRKSRKNRPKTLQNRGPWPPKSSLEPSKTPFLQDIYLKKVKKELHHNFLRPKWPTWLHLGGPRPFKIEAETLKNRW